MNEISIEDPIKELKEGDIVRCYSDYHGCGMIKGIYTGVVIGDYIIITDVGFLKTVGEGKRYPGFIESEYWEESFEKIEVLYREDRPECWEDIFPSKRNKEIVVKPYIERISHSTSFVQHLIDKNKEINFIDPARADNSFISNGSTQKMKSYQSAIFPSGREYLTLKHTLENSFTLYDSANKDAILAIMNLGKEGATIHLSPTDIQLLIYHMCNEINDLSTEVKLFRNKHHKKYDKFDGLVDIDIKNKENSK